jgi:hypothetical protein
MKNLQRFFTIAVLTFALALTAFAGEIGFPGATNSPPPQQSCVTGDISCPDASATGEISAPGMVALDPMTEAALGLLKSILSLF